MREITQTQSDILTIARPIAEAVAPDLAAAAVKRYETRRTSAGLFHSAWNHVEFSIAEDHSEEMTCNYMDTASMLLGEIISRPDTHQDMRLGALLLSTYIPLLYRRKTDKAITPRDCGDVYHSIGRALHHMRPLHTDEPPQWRMTEAAVLALSARITRPELLLYPASPREEQSSNQALNHDSYFFTGNDKLPLQQKLMPTRKVYDECITVLTVAPIISRALKATGEKEHLTLADKVNYLLSLVVAETSGEELEKHETNFLNFMTKAVAAHHTSLANGGRRAATAA